MRKVQEGERGRREQLEEGTVATSACAWPMPEARSFRLGRMDLPR